MYGLFNVLFMSACLGIGSFAVGMLPLSFVFSSACDIDSQALNMLIKVHLESHLTKLSTLGTGLLLGAALGVIIPE